MDRGRDRGKSLLVVHQGALGDIVLTFPTLSLLRERFGRIDLICRGEVGKLAVHLGVADAATTTESAAFASLYGRPSDEIIQRLRRHDAVLLFSFSEALKAAVQGIGPAWVVRLPPRPAPDAPVHVAPWILAEVKAAGLPAPGGPTEPPFFAGRSFEPNPAGPVVLHPGSGSPMKNWPLDRFLTVADRLSDAGRTIECLAGPAEEHLAETLGRSGFPVRTFTALTDLADWLAASAGFIGNDSGVSHLAGYLGAPTVTVFGPSNPRQWRPWGPAVSVASPAEGFDCHPCFEKGNRDCDHRGCLSGISVDVVLERMVEMAGVPARREYRRAGRFFAV